MRPSYTTKEFVYLECISDNCKAKAQLRPHENIVTRPDLKKKRIKWIICDKLYDIASYDVIAVDREHECKLQLGSETYDKKLFLNFIKSFVRSQSDLEVLSLASVYDRLMAHGIKKLGYRKLVSLWPPKEVILRFIKNAKKEIRPPIENITIENKSNYLFTDDLTKL